jgi:hypothetical protein
MGMSAMSIFAGIVDKDVAHHQKKIWGRHMQTPIFNEFFKLGL